MSHTSVNLANPYKVNFKRGGSMAPMDPPLDPPLGSRFCFCKIWLHPDINIPLDRGVSIDLGKGTSLDLNLLVGKGCHYLLS